MTFKEIAKKLTEGGVEYDLTYRQLNLIAAATNSKEFLTTWDLLELEDLEITSEPIEGTLLMQAKHLETVLSRVQKLDSGYVLSERYQTSPGGKKFLICSESLKVLFDSQKAPEFLYLTRVQKGDSK